MKTTKLFICLLFSYFSFSQEQSPNILLIVADDLGVDSMSGFGVATDLPNTPTLNSLRTSGLSFTNCWANPQCTPTRASIMSGKYGIKTGVLRPPQILDVSHTSLFNKIKDQSPTDYSMAVIGKWHIGGNTNFNHPWDSGIPHYEGIFTSQVADYYNWTKLNSSKTTEQVTEYATAHLTNQAISWIGNQVKPWFLWLAHVAPHAPFHTPPSGTYTTTPTNDRTTYLAMIESMDYEIGRLLASMDNETLENTVIIFIGDNGTPARTNVYFPADHVKGSLYEGGIRVPMFITGKSVERVNQVEAGLVNANDLHATILELAGVQLEGGTDNSLSLKPSLSFANSIKREINYTDYEDSATGVDSWAVRTDKYKLIEDGNGNEEFYNIQNDLFENTNLIGSLTTEEQTIKTMLEQEAQIIRTGWSCNDGIKNGTEATIDGCANTCPVTDVLSYDNNDCCGIATHPSVYYEYVENNQRVVYTNNYPNHGFCYVSPRIPEPYYKLYKFDLQPKLSGTVTSISRTNGRPLNYSGIGLNGVYMQPSPAEPFIFLNTSNNQYNWNWTFEPITNIGSGAGFVNLDCASAHVNPNSGYHYHGNMFEYVETLRPGISTTTAIPTEVLQVGWAADGFPMVYKYGPDKDQNIKKLYSSYQLKSGLRPGDGISAPCGVYSGKYTNDFEYIPGKGDLDECNGINAPITLTTAQGQQTFEYYYVVTEDFPQITRCLKGSFSDDFIASNGELADLDNDGDGFVSSFDCDDNNNLINPLAKDNPATTIDESCGNSTLGTLEMDLEKLGFYVSSNPNNGNFNVISTYSGKFNAELYTINGQLISIKSGVGIIEFKGINSSGVYLINITKDNKKLGTKKIIVQ